MESETLPPADLRYARTHEWARIEGGVAMIGVSRYAQEELGAVELVLLPEVGRMLQSGEKFGEIEGANAVTDLYSPVGGVVIAVNEALFDEPEKVSDEHSSNGWILKVRMACARDADLLLNGADYETFIGFLG